MPPFDIPHLEHGCQGRAPGPLVLALTAVLSSNLPKGGGPYAANSSPAGGLPGTAAPGPPGGPRAARDRRRDWNPGPGRRPVLRRLGRLGAGRDHVGGESLSWAAIGRPCSPRPCGHPAATAPCRAGADNGPGTPWPLVGHAVCGAKVGAHRPPFTLFPRGLFCVAPLFRQPQPPRRVSGGAAFCWPSGERRGKRGG